MTRSLPILLIALLLATPLAADQEAARYNRVSLMASAEKEVDNDLLVVVMAAQAEGKNAAEPADEVNRAMDWALSLARSHEGIKVQTLGYRTNAIYENGSIRGWRVHQSVRLEGRDGRMLGDLSARLQQHLRVQSMGYRVSDARRRENIDELTASALQRFQARVGRIAKALGRQDFRIVHLHINDGHHAPVPVARAMMMESRAAGVPAPAQFEAGTQTLTVTVNGEIELTEH